VSLITEIKLACCAGSAAPQLAPHPLVWGQVDCDVFICSRLHSRCALEAAIVQIKDRQAKVYAFV
jgi:hypothetical protein